jgi:hypothetical protein
MHGIDIYDEEDDEFFFDEVQVCINVNSDGTINLCVNPIG